MSSMPPAKRQRTGSGSNGGRPDVPAYSEAYPQPPPPPPPAMLPQIQPLPMQQQQQPLGSMSGGLPPMNGPTKSDKLQVLLSDSFVRPKIKEQVEELSAKTLQDIVIEVAATDPRGPLARALEEAHRLLLERERSRVLNFDAYSKVAWHELNTKYSHLKAARQYEVAGDVGAAIEEMLDKIVQHTKPHSSYGTKLSAIETMCKIFKSVLLADHRIGHEVRKSCYGWDAKFVEVADLFEAEDLNRLAGERYGYIFDKMQQVVSLADEYGVLERLQTGLAILEEGSEDDDWDDEEEEEDDAEEDEEDDEGED